MLVDPDVRAIDEHIFEVGIIGHSSEKPFPDAVLRPTPKAGVRGVPFAERIRQITPGRAGSRNPQHRLNEHPIVTSGGAGITFLAR